MRPRQPLKRGTRECVSCSRSGKRTWNLRNVAKDLPINGADHGSRREYVGAFAQVSAAGLLPDGTIWGMLPLQMVLH